MTPGAQLLAALGGAWLGVIVAGGAMVVVGMPPLAVIFLWLGVLLTGAALLTRGAL